jgi:hypothetical protein
VDQIGGMGEALLLRIDDDVDAALARRLPPERHGLAAMPGGREESHSPEHGAEFFHLVLVGSELDELDVDDIRPVRHLR